jgi:hypothetical protein
VKRSAVLAIVVAIGGLALSTAPAYAGAGGSPSPLTSFFVCQGVTGDSPGRTVNITVPLLGLNLGSVKIGSASLACVFAQLFDPATGAEISPNPGNTYADLKCYAISTKRTPSGGIPATYNVEDVFGTDDVRTAETRYVCAPATLTLP